MEKVMAGLKKVAKRLKNKKVVLAVVSGVLMILLNLGVIDVEVSTKITELTNTILTLGVTVGVFSNPDSHDEIKG